MTKVVKFFPQMINEMNKNDIVILSRFVEGEMMKEILLENILVYF